MLRIMPVPRTGHLDPEAVGQLDVLFDAILPGSETSPGARDAGAADFVDRLLAVDEFYEVEAWRRRYDVGLPALDEVARDRFDRTLTELDAAQATALLADLAAGSLAGFPEGIDQRQLFGTLRAHCIEGCLSDPRWGGNRDRIVWRWLGYAQPPEDFRRTAPGAPVAPAAVEHGTWAAAPASERERETARESRERETERQGERERSHADR